MKLHVAFRNDAVGDLVATDGRFAFTYDDAWLGNPDAFPLSVQMPLSQKDWPSEIAHSFFANLLPEGPSRQIYAERLGVAYDDDVHLLAAIGGDTAGALTFGEGRTQTSRHRVTHDELERFSQGEPALSDDEVVRLSLAGAQHKISAFVADDGIFWPGSDDASTHILKFDSARFSNLSVNEYFMLTLAQNIDLPVVDSELIVDSTRPFLMVERYDRKVENGKVLRLHQEDFCQILGLSHTQKYESAGGPTLARIATAIRQYSARPALDIQSLLRWIIFNALAGNSDGHAKNISLVRIESGLVLAPFYDLVCTRVYKNVDRLLAFSVGGSRDSDQFGAINWKALGTELKVRPRIVRAELKRMLDEHDDAIHYSFNLVAERLGDDAAVQDVAHHVRKRFRGCQNILASKDW